MQEQSQLPKRKLPRDFQAVMPQPTQSIDPALRRAVHESFMRDPRFRFWYFVPHPDQDMRDVSIFMGFTSGIVQTAELFQRIVEWPCDIREPFTERQHVLRARTSGVVEQRIAPAEYSAFSKMVDGLNVPLRCVISDENSCNWVDEQIATAKIPWMHISTVRGTGRIAFDTAKPLDFLAYASRVCSSMEGLAAYDGIRLTLERMLAEPRFTAVKQVACPSFEHNVTAPNEYALKSLRFRASMRSPLRPDKPGRYVEAILRTTEVVAQQRNAMLAEAPWAQPPTDFTLAVDGDMLIAQRREYYEALRHRSISKTSWRLILNSARRRETFISDIVATMIDSKDLQSIIFLRATELRAFTTALTLQNSGTMTPVIRLEPRLNQIRWELQRIGGCARGHGPHRAFKLRKLRAGLGRVMREKVDERIVRRLDAQGDRIRGVSLVSDLPLEWMQISGNALSLRHDVSRVPVTPGSLMFGICMQSVRTFLTPDSFREILVVRSFGDEDPLRLLLEQALAARAVEDGPSISFRFVDVQTLEEFVAALQSFTGAVMIFDGHGLMDQEAAAGFLMIGGNPVEIWKYRALMRMPPIVLLSACDTLPVDGSTGSSAVSFLTCGAETVLATLLPIDGMQAAIFLARLAFRIEAFIPAALSISPHGISWRLMMSGMLRMAHATEVLRGLLAQGFLTAEDYLKTHLLSNQHINARNPDWFEVVRRDAVARSQKPAEETLEVFDHLSSMTEALMYVQLGRPELITIVEETTHDAISRLDPSNNLGLPKWGIFSDQLEKEHAETKRSARPID